MTERYTFSSLHDFLFVELGKAILRGNSPRQCRLCGRWFLHEQGDRAMYCERIAPGEESKTCREAGARAVFEKKIQDEDTWKLYKRAYKKYYARYMKGNMSEEAFKAWAAQAAAWNPEVLIVTSPSDYVRLEWKAGGDLDSALHRPGGLQGRGVWSVIFHRFKKPACV